MAELSQDQVVTSDPEAGLSVEERLLKTSDEIKDVLDEMSREAIDPSTYTQIIEEFTEEKKAELEGIVEQVNDPLGKKVKTFSTLAYNARFVNGLAYQEVWMKDGAITKYGDLFVQGAKPSSTTMGGAGVAGFVRQPFPQDVEFDMFAAEQNGIYARPKAGQSNVGGITGSLDNYIFVLGLNYNGSFGLGNTSNVNTPKAVELQGRAKKILASAYADANRQCLVLLDNGDLYFAGYGGQGSNGIGNTTSPTTFTKITGDVLDIFQVCWQNWAVKANSILAWGQNVMGSLGVGSTGVINTPTLAKSDVVDPNSVRVFSTQFTNGSTSYGISLISSDGKIYGAGRNDVNQIFASDTAQKNSLTQIALVGGTPLDFAEGSTMATDGDSTYFLVKNGANFDFYSAGGGTGLGLGDGTTSQKIAKRRTFEGDGWEIVMTQQYCNASSGWCLYVVNKKKRKIFSFGSNKDALGSGATSGSRSFVEVLMPQETLSAENFEVFSFFHSNVGALAVIADGEIYACGNNTSGMLKFATNTLQKQ